MCETERFTIAMNCFSQISLAADADSNPKPRAGRAFGVDYWIPQHPPIEFHGGTILSEQFDTEARIEDALRRQFIGLVTRRRKKMGQFDRS